MILQTRQLVKHFRLDRRRTVQAVDGVSLEISETETLGLVGESGSGKSTLGLVLAGLLPKTSGEAWFGGERLPDRYRGRDFRRLGRRIQMIFQDPAAALNPRMTVLETIGEGLRLTGLARGAALKGEAAEWLIRVGLSPDQMSRYPHEFSGGQKQRIGIARALAVRPKLVICDEPISALDLSVQAQIVELLARLKREMGLTLIFIAHDLAMVRHISDRMAVMYLGVIVEIGPADAVFFNPRHPYTQLLAAANPRPDPAFERNRAAAPPTGEIPSPINIGPGCRFAGRCPQVEPRCRAEAPLLREVAAGHEAACHLAG